MTAFISASTQVFDYAYDTGWLPLSSTVHMWLDFFYYTAMGLQVFGRPLGDNTGNNQTSVVEVKVSSKGISVGVAF